MTLRRRPLAEDSHPGNGYPGRMTETENHDPGTNAESALQRAESDLHPADKPDALRTAEYGRESAAARRDTPDGTATPKEAPAD